MNINYEIRETDYYGKGVYALDTISAGTCIWTYKLNENVFEYDENESIKYLNSLQNLKEQQKFLDTSFGKGEVLSLIIDDGQYVNHAEMPLYNCKTDQSNGNCYAIRDIGSGEQIFEDYLSYSHPPFLISLLKQYNCEPDYYEIPK
jgi:hypothetical protein